MVLFLAISSALSLAQPILQKLSPAPFRLKSARPRWMAPQPAECPMAFSCWHFCRLARSGRGSRACWTSSNGIQRNKTGFFVFCLCVAQIERLKWFHVMEWRGSWPSRNQKHSILAKQFLQLMTQLLKLSRHLCKWIYFIFISNLQIPPPRHFLGAQNAWANRSSIWRKCGPTFRLAIAKIG